MRKMTTIALLLVGLLLIALSGRMHSPMQSLRWGGGEPNDIQWDEDSDPTVKLVTVMLGPFRGVIADVLWIRASRLQDEGKYFELVQLADMITKLEPRFPEVWDYHGWNMAYNVSVYFDEPEERWRWVQNGYRLLRDDGLKYNPTNPKIHEQLAWTFQHKIGMNSDDAHRYYKTQWLEQMEKLIPGGKLENAGIPEALFEEDAPSPYKKAEYEDMLEAGEISTNVFELVTEYKMRPWMMKHIDDKYGPFDWRIVQAHSTYWAALGLSYSTKKNHAREQLHRRVSQSMMQNFHRGQPIILPESRYLHFFPDFEKVDEVIQSYTDAIEDIPDQKTFVLGRRNFFRSAVPTLHVFGKQKEAKEFYDLLQELHPAKERPPFEEYVKKLDEKEISTLNTLEAFNLIVGNLAQARMIRNENPVDAALRENFARQIFAGFGERISADRQDVRIGLGLWAEMEWAADRWVEATHFRPAPLGPVPVPEPAP